MMKALVVIWPSALNKKLDILNEIKKEFEIYNESDFFISNESSEWLLSEMYQVKKSYLYKKKKDIGTGRCYLIEIGDKNPILKIENTMSGLQYLNSNFLNLKLKLRSLEGTNGQIHITNNDLEFNKHFPILKSLIFENQSNDLVEYQKIEDFFESINFMVNYVVIRKGESIYDNQEKILNSEEDIDILVDDYFEFIKVTRARRVYTNSYDNRHMINVRGKPVLIDVGYLGDNELDINWQRSMLLKKIRYKNIYVPNPIDQFYSYLYHILFHKPEVDNEAKTYLKNYMEKLKENKEIITSDFNINSLLKNYMLMKGYYIYRPNNMQIYYNLVNVDKFGLGKRTLFFNLPTVKSHYKKIIHSYYKFFRFKLRELKSYVYFV